MNNAFFIICPIWNRESKFAPLSPVSQTDGKSPGPVVQWIEWQIPVLLIWVRIPSGSHLFRKFLTYLENRYRSQSIAAMQPDPAAVIACR